VKTFILYSLLMTSPDGNQWELDSHLSLADCQALSVPGEIVSYFDGARVWQSGHGCGLHR
jgi:hypothetical protein